MERQSARGRRWPNYCAALISVFLFASFTPPVGAKKPHSEKAQKRIHEIEKDYQVGFYNETEFILADGTHKTYWQFLIRMDLTRFRHQGFPFAVLPFATDRQVEDAVASSLATATFYEHLDSLIVPPDASPTPSPSPAGYKETWLRSQKTRRYASSQQWLNAWAAR